MGRLGEARRTLERMSASAADEIGQIPQGPALAAGSPVALATVHAALGDHDEAFRLLMKAIDARDHSRLLFIKVDPPFASLRSDPRWRDVLDLMKLPK
jgi:hypothetical protein